MDKLLTLAMLLISVSASAQQGEIVAAREIVKAVLKDPYTAQFSNERKAEGGVCGDLNAKNSYGAYTGNRRYVVRDGAATINDNANPHSTAFWQDRCGE